MRICSVQSWVTLLVRKQKSDILHILPDNATHLHFNWIFKWKYMSAWCEFSYTDFKQLITSKMKHCVSTYYKTKTQYNCRAWQAEHCGSSFMSYNWVQCLACLSPSLNESLTWSFSNILHILNRLSQNQCMYYSHELLWDFPWSLKYNCTLFIRWLRFWKEENKVWCFRKFLHGQTLQPILASRGYDD